MQTKFQQWLTDHQPDDDLLWKRSFWNTYTFWRNKILPMFTDEFYKKDWNYEILNKEMDHNSDVVGKHVSKCIASPVVKIAYKGTIIVFRYNFYEYEIAVISNKPINIPMKKLFTSRREAFFYQGFPEKYKIKERYEENKCQFIAKVYDHYNFYTFMFLLQRQIYLNSKKRPHEYCKTQLEEKITIAIQEKNK